jgi:hypothetical protein
MTPLARLTWCYKSRNVPKNNVTSSNARPLPLLLLPILPLLLLPILLLLMVSLALMLLMVSTLLSSLAVFGFTSHQLHIYQGLRRDLAILPEFLRKMQRSRT